MIFVTYHAVLCRVLAHRGDDAAVAQSQAPQLQWLEELRRGRTGHAAHPSLSSRETTERAHVRVAPRAGRLSP
jgi:hypothetical protein